MSTISNELVKDLRMAFAVWQQDYDPVEDKEQYDMLGLGVVAMDELLALRKERERAEPVYQCMDDGKWYDTEKRLYDEVKENGNECRVLYIAPMVADDSLPYDSQIAEYEQMMEAEQAQADTTSQQFESLASVKQPSSNLAATGKASRDSDANSSHDSQTTIKQSDGWIPCSERMPGIGEAVLMRISCSDHFNIESGRYKGDGLWLGCWFSIRGKKESPYQVAHWMPIPAAPEPCK
ncbi:DUF551 domain-containing protein [Cronobacter dublinensis]